MPEITLTAEVGRESGTRITRRLRREGKIPGVIYGHGSDPVSVAVNGPDLRVALSGDAGTNQLIELVCGKERYLVLARQLQRHPVRGTLQHVDFQITGRDETVTVEVPVIIVGDAVEVRHADGAVDQQLFVIAVSARPGAIPSVLELDISAMVPGDILRVADLVMPEGAQAAVDPESAIAIAHVGRSAREEGEGGAEGELGAEPGEASAPAES